MSWQINSTSERFAKRRIQIVKRDATNLIKDFGVTKADLIEILKRLLKTDSDFDYLYKLTEPEIRSLISVIRERIEAE